MGSAQEVFTNININEERENMKSASITKQTLPKEDSSSVCSLNTCEDSHNYSIQKSRKIELTRTKRSISTKTVHPNKYSLYIEEKLNFSRRESSLDFSKIFKKETKKKTVEKKEINVKKKEINMKKNKKNVKKHKINGKNGYSQTYCREDFVEHPYEASNLFSKKYKYEVESQKTGKINEDVNMFNIFYNHLIIKPINISHNGNCICTSLNKRFKEKTLTIIYYSP